ncbi:hypothetical protein [Streptomyces sp. NBC_00096]|uniref:hypothetical protein n=1 Tax=Streptomyces sp. NBC_00096 TaxID=2975650 RepID=UPI003246FD19
MYNLYDFQPDPPDRYATPAEPPGTLVPEPPGAWTFHQRNAIDRLPDASFTPPYGLELADLLPLPRRPSSSPVPQPRPAPGHHRRTSRRLSGQHAEPSRPPSLRALRLTSALLTAVITASVSALNVMVSYPSLHRLADSTAPPGTAFLWPLLVYAPWAAAILSILRGARTCRRHTTHSWCVAILFTTLTIALCISEVPITPSGVTVAGLPPITVLFCFHQLVRQLDSTHAPTTHRAPR